VSPRRFRIHFSTEALADLRHIADFVSIDSPANAARLTERILDRIDTLETLPRRCARAPDCFSAEGETRHLFVSSYRIIFQVKTDEVIIQAIRHGHQRPIDRRPKPS